MSKLLLLFLFVTITVALNWQASGFGHGGWYGSSMSTSAPNLPRLYVEIDKAIDAVDATPATMCGNISAALNAMWDPAWNVAVLQKSDPKVDVVVVGYAFRNHWTWHNNYRTYSIGIWKDYNC